MSSPVTPEIIEQLRAEFQSRMHRSATEIAAELGVTKGTLIGALNRAGIRSPKYQSRTGPVAALDQEHLREVVSSMPTWAQAGRALGVNPPALASHCRARGIRLQPPKPGPHRGFNSYRAASRVPATPADLADMRRLADAAVAAGRVTKCPPAYARGSTSMIWEHIL
jgi:hypothetical protein